MADQKKQMGPEDVIAHLEGTFPSSECTDRCREKYLKDVEACNGDRDCIARATGRYVICVLSCPRK